MLNSYQFTKNKPKNASNRCPSTQQEVFFTTQNNRGTQRGSLRQISERIQDLQGIPNFNSEMYHVEPTKANTHQKR